MKHRYCDNICDDNGLVMTLIATDFERKVINQGPDGYMIKDTEFKTYKKIQCEKCLYLTNKEVVKYE